MLDQFNGRQKENATVAVFRADQKDRYGKVEFNEKYLAKSFCKSQCDVGEWGNGGFYCFKNKEKLELVLADLSGYFSFENEVMPQLVSKKFVNVFTTNGTFLDIGVPADYLAAEKEIVNWKKF